MKKLLLFVFAALAFAACEQAPVEEQSAIRQDAPETITVGFEGNDTRIQLNEAQKTVWTKGDLVSVFYRSNANQQWKYDGETGARTAELKRVDVGTSTRDIDRVVVVYPYNEDYYINPETYNVQTSLPAVQNYLKDSYGLDGNIMISSSEYNQFSLKSVCGWLKLQLTGDGETIKSIKFRGNDGEQVAGELYINSADATAALASDMGNADDNNAGGSLVFDDTILTEVTLDCGEGVALGKNATAFYIALPPQTFEQGFTVEIEDAEGYVMEQSTDKALTIERNHIQPMAAIEFTPLVPNNQIWYTSSDGNVVTPYKTNAFGATITSNEYNNGMGIITFDGDVTTIGDWAFRDCNSLTSVNIPDSITTIGNYAFYYCRSLTSVNIPDSVTTIGYEAFYVCTSLKSVNIPDSVTTIREGAFQNCTSLTSVNIPDSVTTIGEGAFSSCDSLTEFSGKFAEDNGRILVVDGVLTAFAPAGITEYTIPDSVTTIGGYAFYWCTSLTSVNIPDSVSTMEGHVFHGCQKLTEVKLSKNITKIEYDAFNLCVNLVNIDIHEGVTIINNRAFQSCSKLSSVLIPNSVTTIGEDAFKYCDSLNSVIIGNSVETIGNNAFYYCNNLSSLIIPDSVKSIGDYAFYQCDKLSSLNLGNSLTKIGAHAFQFCKSLTEVTIPDSVTTMDVYCFEYCENLTSVTIGNSVEDIKSYAFYNCDKLTNIYCKATTPPHIDYHSVLSNDVPGRNIYVPAVSVNAYKTATYWKNFTDAIVGYDFENGEIVEVQPNNEIWYTSSDGDVVTPFETNVFGANIISNKYNNGMGVITFDGNVTMIGEGAFYDCDLTSVTIPDSVTEIGYLAFARCDSLQEFKGKFTSEDGSSLIKDNTIIAYANASGTTYTIPDSVTSIGDYAFGWCDSLTSVNIPDSVTTIGERAFSACESLTSVNIPDSVTMIGNYAFSSCYSLTSVNIPDSVTEIGDYAFRYCTSLTSVNIPDSVTTIGYEAFYWCTSLTSVYCKATTPPALGWDVFYNNGSGRKIYVPAGSVNAYKSAGYWSEYASDIVGYNF